MQAQLKFNFNHNYNANVKDEWPIGFEGNCLYYPGAKTGGGKDGLMVEVHSLDKGKRWIGVFAFGMSTAYNGFSAICSTPDPSTVCIVASGSGYVVNVYEPKSWQELPIFPILEIQQILESDLILFSGNTKIGAWGRKGLLWLSTRLALDNLKITGINNGVIQGIGSNFTGTGMASFAIDLMTGEHL